MKSVLAMCFSPLERDPRLLRQVDALKNHCRMTAAGFTPPGVEGVEFVALDAPDYSLPAKLRQAAYMKLRLFEAYYWSQPHIQTGYARLKDGRFHTIIADELETLPLAARLAREQGAKLIYDAYEYAPRQFEHIWRWRFFLQAYRIWACRRYMPRADLCLTVAEPLVEAYAREFGVRCELSLSLPYPHDITPRPTGSVIRLVHHGLAFPGRNLAPMFELAKLLDERFETTFVLVPGDAAYIARLKAEYGGHPRIRFAEPVAFDAIVTMLSAYDIGLCLLQADTFNLENCLPNKFFESIQARLALATGPSPAMAAYMRRYGLGVVAQDYTPQTLAARINALSVAEIDGFKANSHAAAAKLHHGVMVERWKRWALEEA